MGLIRRMRCMCFDVQTRNAGRCISASLIPGSKARTSDLPVQTVAGMITCCISSFMLLEGRYCSGQFAVFAEKSMPCSSRASAGSASGAAGRASFSLYSRKIGLNPALIVHFGVLPFLVTCTNRGCTDPIFKKIQAWFRFTLFLRLMF